MSIVITFITRGVWRYRQYRRDIKYVGAVTAAATDEHDAR